MSNDLRTVQLRALKWAAAVARDLAKVNEAPVTRFAYIENAEALDELHAGLATPAPVQAEGPRDDWHGAFVDKWAEEMFQWMGTGCERWRNVGRKRFMEALLADLPVSAAAGRPVLSSLDKLALQWLRKEVEPGCGAEGIDREAMKMHARNVLDRLLAGADPQARPAATTNAATSSSQFSSNANAAPPTAETAWPSEGLVDALAALVYEAEGRVHLGRPTVNAIREVRRVLAEHSPSIAVTCAGGPATTTAEAVPMTVAQALMLPEVRSGVKWIESQRGLVRVDSKGRIEHARREQGYVPFADHSIVQSTVDDLYAECRLVEPEAELADACTSHILYRRGFADGRRRHPPAELTRLYIAGYSAGQREPEADPAPPVKTEEG